MAKERREQDAAGSGRRASASELVAVALGGALGAPARYGVAQLVHVAPGTFPWATFWTNVSGSFGLGVVLGGVLVLDRPPTGRYVRPLLATGFLGAYTTYSTFAVESDLLVRDGHLPVAVAYAVVSLVAGFGAAWAGVLLARWMVGRRRAGP